MIATYRILYVDDEPALLDIGRVFLEQSGEFSVVAIESAPAALALLKRERFDAIVSDYDMPVMNGIEFLSEVRTRFGKIPFIIFTGKGGKEEVIQAINKGVDYYLQKGGDPELMFVDLSHKIRQAVSGRRADEALRESELRYRSLFENMQEGFSYCRILYDKEDHPADFIYLTVNPAFDRILGTTAIAGKPATEVFPGIKEKFPELFEIYGRVALTGEPESFDLDFRPSEKWLHVSVYSPAREYFVAVFDDITERKKAEGALAQTNEYLNNLFDHANAPIIVWDPEFVITRFNHAFEELTSRAEPEVLGQQLDILFPEESRDHSRILIKKALKGERWETVEIPILIKDGSIRTVLWNSANVLNSEGRIISTIAQGVDITGRKIAEEALQTLTRELETRVLQRTSELKQEIVQRNAAEKTIISSLHEKEILLREIHHRVKNNLQIITSLLRLQKQQITDPDTIHALQDSESRIGSMALVHEKLYRSSDLAQIDFTDYIRSLTTSLITAYASDPHRIGLVIDVKDVSLDINRAIPVGLIMNELVANALRHAFPNGRSGKITITGRRTPAGITLTVQDNGVGLPEGLDWKNAPTLGLHLAITLIRQVNGSIELNRSGGTAFEMLIPSAIKETSS